MNNHNCNFRGVGESRKRCHSEQLPFSHACISLQILAGSVYSWPHYMSPSQPVEGKWAHGSLHLPILCKRGNSSKYIASWSSLFTSSLASAQQCIHRFANNFSDSASGRNLKLKLAEDNSSIYFLFKYAGGHWIQWSKKKGEKASTDKKNNNKPYIFITGGEITEVLRDPSGLQIGFFVTHKNSEIVYSDRFYPS